jgi:hypothetical protein
LDDISNRAQTDDQNSRAIGIQGIEGKMKVSRWVYLSASFNRGGERSAGINPAAR